MSWISNTFTVPGTADKRAGRATMESTKKYAEDLAAGGLTPAMRAYLNHAGASVQTDFSQMANLLGQKYQGMGLGNSSFAGNALSQLANNAGQSMTQARVGLLPMMAQNQQQGNEMLYGMGQDQYQRGQAAGDAMWNGVGSFLGTAANLYTGGAFGALGGAFGALGGGGGGNNPQPATQMGATSGNRWGPALNVQSINMDPNRNTGLGPVRPAGRFNLQLR